ncbi:hypothetical protein L207DRAFT_628456 [Hyaloscypha variabilis F]|uniref:Mid2 domain-containing protein n=1 Tax=Hyaloscypha variabilis (strain UAMH 11265 / GT02V1 / F) TaxID=1149755 RepID=A0A2J6SAT6_HYAVF|nr:hypothetical protein L207DRAFT_628456 [Hyaloscypha variabilis F]
MPLLLFILVFIKVTSAAVAAATPRITPAPRWISAGPDDQGQPYFLGYIPYYDTASGDMLWSSFDCNPGSTLTTSTWANGTGAACVPYGVSTGILPTTCINSHTVLGPSGYGSQYGSGHPDSYTCTPETCEVGIIYENLDELTPPWTIISCDSPFVIFTIYRATTHSGISSAFASTTSGASATTAVDTSSTTSSNDSQSTNSQSNGNQPNSNQSDNNQSNNIALGVGIGLGIPAIVIAFCAWWFPRQAALHRTENREAAKAR